MIRVKTRASFFLYLILIAVLSSPQAVLAAVCALIVHEAGHLAAGIAAGEKVESIELTPFGGIIRYSAGRCGQKGLNGVLIASSGPAANYLFILLVGSAAGHNILEHSLAEKMIVANASMILLNLIPALPLDGGRIILSAGFFLCSLTVLIRVLCIAGVLAGFALIAVAIYGFVQYGVLNCSLVIVGAYLIACAYMSGDALICENTYTVIRERRETSNGLKRIRIFSVPPGTKMYELLPVICRTDAPMFVFDADGKAHWITESDVLSALKSSPAAAIEEIDVLSGENIGK